MFTVRISCSQIWRVMWDAAILRLWTSQRCQFIVHGILFALIIVRLRIIFVQKFTVVLSLCVKLVQFHAFDGIRVVYRKALFLLRNIRSRDLFWRLDLCPNSIWRLHFSIIWSVHIHQIILKVVGADLRIFLLVHGS